MYITAFTMSCTGSRVLNEVADQRFPPCPATGRMGEACQRDTPVKAGQAGPFEGTQSGTARVGPKE
jgi:hypothetical protein